MIKQPDKTNEGTLLARTRMGARIDRRAFMQGLSALGAAGALAPFRSALAATTVNWIGWDGFTDLYNAEQYLEKNDIVLQPTFISSNEETMTKLQAGGLGTIDFHSLDAAYLQLFDAAELLQPIDMSRISNAEGLFPEFRDHASLRFDGQQWGVPYSWGYFPLVYDPAAVSGVPTSWFDILKPEYEGKVVMINDPLGLIIVYGSVAGGAEHATLLSHEQLKKCIDFLITVKTKHARALADSYTEAADMFARGEVVITANGWDPIVAMAAEKGKTLESVVPKEGAGAYLEVLCLPRQSPHPDISLGLINHAISPAAQASLAESLRTGICNREAAMALDEDLMTLHHYRDLGDFLANVEIWKSPPLERNERYATFDDVLEEYERFLKA